MEIRNTASIGSDAEQQAFEYLKARGLVPLFRNFRCRDGEIDLIMLDGNCLTFIEVRFRADTGYSRASHTVDIVKQRKIIRTAAVFLAQNQRFRNNTARFDVVAVEGSVNREIEWIADAFRPNDPNF